MHEPVPPCEVPFPPWLARLLPDLSNAALRVSLVVLHETVSWEAESAILSRADLASLSGLAQSSVQLGIEEALKWQILQRAPVGMGYAYRLKAPSDSSAFPLAPSRNVTALRQLKRLQQRLQEITEFERASLERGPRSSFKSADHASVKKDDRSAVGTNDPTTNNTTDRASVREDDRISVQSPDLDRISVECLGQPASKPDRRAVGLDRKAVRQLTETPSTTDPNGNLGVDRLPVSVPVNRCNQSGFSPSRVPMCAGAPKDINNIFIPKHTVWEKSVGESSVRERARVTTPLSMFSYGEVLAYAQSLKGLRNPGGLAVVYWRSGEMDAEIANYQRRQAQIAERQAAEAVEREAEMREQAREMLARGEPFAEWEREFIAAYADELQEEHDVQIQRLDAAHSNAI